MNAAAELCLRDQVFESAAIALDVINEVNLGGSNELVTLKEGLRSLRDTLLGAYHVVTPEVDPFYYLCLQLCNCLKKSFLSDHVHDLEGHLVLGYSFWEFQDALLASCHSLDTYLNIIRWSAVISEFVINVLTIWPVRPANLTTILEIGAWNAFPVLFATFKSIKPISIISMTL